MAGFALNKQAKLLLAGVFLAAAVVILIGYMRRQSGPLPNSVNFVCAQTGQKFSIDRTKIDQVPLKNPKTGEMTLVPCYVENGVTYVSPRYRGALDDVACGAIRPDAKTELQELLQADGGDTPSYHVVGTSGPEHSKVFEVEIAVGEEVIARGRGRSKKEAEKDAAQRALRGMGTGDEG